MLNSNKTAGIIVKTGVWALLAGTLSFAQTPIRVLFWGGGVTAHNPTALKDTLLRYVGAQGMTLAYRADSTNSPVWLHADTLAQYDVLLVYTTNQNAAVMSQTQFNALRQWIESGHVIVTVHGSTNTYLNGNATIATAWRQLLGALFLDHATGNNAGTITFTQPNHPSLQGASALPASALATGGTPYWDEGRRHQTFVTDTVVIARARLNATDSAVPWIWVRRQGQGWVYYNASGHDGQVWRRAEWRGQVFQALRWGAAVGTTGIRGRAALQPLIRFYQGEIRLPTGEEHSIQITDMQGRPVFSRRRSRVAQHDLSAISPGAYFVEVLFPDRDSFRKLYVKRP